MYIQSQDWRGKNLDSHPFPGSNCLWSLFKYSRTRLSTLLNFLYHPLFSLCQMLYPRKLEVGIARVGWAYTKQRIDTNCWLYSRHLLCSLLWVSQPDLRHCHQPSCTDRRYSNSGDFTQKPFKNTFQALINNSSLWGESCPSPCGDGMNRTHGEHLMAFTFNQGFPGSSVFLCSGQILLFLLCLCCFVL